MACARSYFLALCFCLCHLRALSLNEMTSTLAKLPLYSPRPLNPAHINDNSNTSLEPFALRCVALRCDGNDASSSHLIPTQISAYWADARVAPHYSKWVMSLCQCVCVCASVCTALSIDLYVWALWRNLSALQRVQSSTRRRDEVNTFWIYKCCQRQCVDDSLTFNCGRARFVNKRALGINYGKHQHS